jgi:hypothetical protein
LTNSVIEGTLILYYYIKIIYFIEFTKPHGMHLRNDCTLPIYGSDISCQHLCVIDLWISADTVRH